MVEMPLLIISRVAPVVLGSVFFASELVVRVLLPSFEEGLVPLQILLVGTYFSSVPRGLSSFFITLRRQAQTVHLYLLSILGNGLIVWWLLASGYGLAGAAAGTTISLAFFGYGLIVLALRYFMGVKELLVELAKLTWPLGLGVALALIARHAGLILAGPGEGLYAVVAGSILGGALFLAAYSPVVWHLYRAYGSQLRAPAVDEEVSQA